ncbi:MAG TPA: response regulator [Thermoanaerobaculia bacterium]|nr:response regulator [Thermoanaerobaculia bacterium]
MERILIAEDSPTQAQRLRHILEQHGYEVGVAGNGRLALEMAPRFRPAMIISDVVMPEMDGYELSRRVKAEGDLRNIPVILVTTMSDPQDVIRGLECGADNFVLKPYDEGYLLDRVRYVLANRQLRREEEVVIGVEIYFNGQRHFITADRLQILNLLLSTYDAAIQRNKELNRSQEELERTNLKLNTLTSELEDRVKQRTMELERSNQALSESEARLRRLNEELEQRVEERTAQLEAANRELESFSYSVSHDLRAPLRALSGYARMLEEDYAGDLDDEGLRYLSVISDSSVRMGVLIDDLLSFSRLGRQPVAKRELDMSQLVREVIEEALQSHQGQRPEIEVGPLPPAEADRGLMRQVWMNLISNAFKYSSKSPDPTIEVRGRKEGSRNVYSIRDNGAGFNMNYYDKLFGVFQRLHSAHEFGGTGVGLAIVQRVVTRHGGRVWAEARVNEGAMFSFTLPTEEENARAEADYASTSSDLPTDSLR